MRRTILSLTVAAISLFSVGRLEAGHGMYTMPGPMGCSECGACDSCGEVVYEGCGTGCGCGTCCGLPNLLGGVDRLLKKLFWGHRGCGCGMATCGECSSCGGCDECGGPVASCDSCGGGRFVPSEGMVVPAGPSDPFVDDAHASAAMLRTKTYRTASVPQPTRRRVVTPAPERVTVSNARAIKVANAEPLKATKKSPTLAEPTRKTKSTVRPASSDTSDVRAPSNPLRN